MRPVIKWNVGEEGVRAEYKPYGNAKAVLLRNFGHSPNYYCNYCDRLIPMVNMEVEHILPKSVARYEHLEFSWTNFLLSCKNCNLAKGAENIDFDEFYWPHIHNTRPIFVVNVDGTISCNPGLDAAEQNISQETIRLLNLDCGHTTPRRQPQDDRYMAREYVLRLAERKLIQRRDGKLNDDDIIELAITNGFWLVWMQVFEEFPGIRTGLIHAFKNTYEDCLDDNIIRAHP
ncbi:MAG: HNH endonuclease [Sphingobacteriaceae bacterium]|nr:HNH endonuclease [Sphingobacteriaceae bacterium]